VGIEYMLNDKLFMLNDDSYYIMSITELLHAK